MNLHELRHAMKQDAWHLLPARFAFSIDLYAWHDSSAFKNHVTELIAWVRSHDYNFEEWRDERTRRQEFQFEHQNPSNLARRLLERSGIDPYQRPSTPLRSTTVHEWANTTLGEPFDLPATRRAVDTITTEAMQRRVRDIQRQMLESASIAPSMPVHVTPSLLQALHSTTGLPRPDIATPASVAPPPPPKPPVLLLQPKGRYLTLTNP